MTSLIWGLCTFACSQRHCPKFNSEGKLVPRETCFMDLRTEPPYRQAVQKYQFLMNASNALDREGLHKALPIDHYSIGKTKDVAIGSVSSGCGVVVAFVSFCFDCLSSFCSVAHDTSVV